MKTHNMETFIYTTGDRLRKANMNTHRGNSKMHAHRWIWFRGRKDKLQEKSYEHLKKAEEDKEEPWWRWHTRQLAEGLKVILNNSLLFYILKKGRMNP